METNGISVPDEGQTTQYIADKKGGWMYVVTTTTSVEMVALPDFDKRLTDAKQRVAEAQTVVDELQPVVDAIK